MLQGVSRIVRKHLYLVISVAAALLIIILGGAVAAHNDNNRLNPGDNHLSHHAERVLADRTFRDVSKSKKDHSYPPANDQKTETDEEENDKNTRSIDESEHEIPAPKPPVQVVDPEPIHVDPDPPIEINPPLPHPMPPCGGCGPTLRVKNIACPMTEQMNSQIVCAL